MLQEGKECREGALVACQREPLPLEVDAHADRPASGVVGQREEDVFLPAVTDEEAAQRGVLQHAVSVLHSQRPPVEAAALELGGGLGDDVAVLLGGESWEVGQVDGAGRAGPQVLVGLTPELLGLGSSCLRRGQGRWRRRGG